MENKLEQATKKARAALNKLADEYNLDIAKRAFFRVQRDVSKKQALLERKKELEKELEKLNKAI